MARPQNQWVYGEPSLARLAASYAFGISRNHPFLDGNKRTSLVVTELFLDLNGIELTATDAECVATFLQLAAGRPHRRTSRRMDCRSLDYRSLT